MGAAGADVFAAVAQPDAITKAKHSAFAVDPRTFALADLSSNRRPQEMGMTIPLTPRDDAPVPAHGILLSP
jgi:hypothetical protein